jgi:hypothetical protein
MQKVIESILVELLIILGVPGKGIFNNKDERQKRILSIVNITYISFILLIYR